MSYTPLTDVNTELEALNAEQDGQTLLQKDIKGLLIELITEQRITNKYFQQIVGDEIKENDINK